MTPAINPIVETYSHLAEQYDDELNLRSCWGLSTERALASLVIKDDYQVVLDVGCGTGRALHHLSATSRPGVHFVGVDPAQNMRQRAIQRTKDSPAVRILDGSFEQIPLESCSVDYLYSIYAFHWTTNLDLAVNEIARVLKPDAEMDLFFIGRNNGREFIQRTSPIFLKFMGPALLLESARMRKQLKKEQAYELFGKSFCFPRLSVEESYETYYDTLEGHWGWWVRIEGHFMRMRDEKRNDCNAEVREVLRGLEGNKGIPYTIHRLHVRLCRNR